MSKTSFDLPAVISSRICHDLISPIGAISNGIELLSMSDSGPLSPEMELIRDSCAFANARIRFFRIAFGQARPGFSQPAREIHDVLGELAKSSRVQFKWSGSESPDRCDVQMAFLAAMCLEAVMPRGGTITLSDNRGEVHATCDGATEIARDHEIWAALSHEADSEETPPAAQAAMLCNVADRQSRSILSDPITGRITLRPE